ncbi:hypothetical protein E9993_07870 [Labilibacter sediminis]|nr:hypothetical protein E9993_07870 [Labilibacter sediminis]
MARKKSLFQNNIENQGELFIAIAFFLLCFFIRFPFFFRDYIDHDESTFILMGQSLVDGNLPYTALWDLKPPFVFYFFGAVIALFGKSFIAIRLAGVFVISITTWFVYLIGKSIKSKRFGFYNGIGYIVLSSLFGTMQGVMSEHLAMVFCVAGVYIFVKGRDSLGGLFLSAVLLGISIMFRLNLVYAIFVLYVVYIFSSKLTVRQFFLRGFIISVGVVLATGLGFLPYVIQGIPEVWWNSVVKASLDYAGSGSGRMFDVAKSLLPVVIIWLTGFIYSRKIAFFQPKDKNVWYLRIFTGALMFMLIKGGRLNGHYLVQLFPFMLFFVLEVFSLINFKKLSPVRFLLYILLLIPIESYIEYAKLGQRISQGKSLYNGPSFEVTQYIKDQSSSNESSLFLYYHISYWLLDVDPPSKIGTHPSNLLRSYLYSNVEGSKENPMAEMRSLFESRPSYVVNRSERLPFGSRSSEANKYYQKQIAENYTLVKEFGRAKVYRRK